MILGRYMPYTQSLLPYVLFEKWNFAERDFQKRSQLTHIFLTEGDNGIKTLTLRFHNKRQ
jgi:hypothetical protein